MKKSEKHTYSK